MKKELFNIFDQFQSFQQELGRLEEKMIGIEQRIENLLQIERNHLIRIKNNEELSDDFLYHGRKYFDLTPTKAWKLYAQKDFDFIFIDVSDADYKSLTKIPEAIHIPLEELKERYTEITSKTVPILIISEDGTKSILASEFLVSRGYFNCNNISGGHRFWIGHKIHEVNGETA